MKIEILAVPFFALLVISMIGSVSAEDVWAGKCIWQGCISINGGSQQWQTITPIDVQKGPDGLYHTPPIDFNVKLDGYPKTVNGFYSLKFNESGHLFLLRSGLLTWNYTKGDDGAVVVDDFIARGYKSATWHFIWTSHKLILSDYYNAYPPKLPGNITNTTLPGNITNTTLPGNITNTTLPGNITNTTLPGNITNTTLPGNITNTTLPGNITNTTLPGNITNITCPGTNSNATVPVYGEETIPMQNTGMPLTPLIAALITIGSALLYPRYKK